MVKSSMIKKLIAKLKKFIDKIKAKISRKKDLTNERKIFVNEDYIMDADLRDIAVKLNDDYNNLPDHIRNLFPPLSFG